MATISHEKTMHLMTCYVFVFFCFFLGNSFLMDVFVTSSPLWRYISHIYLRPESQIKTR